MEVASNKKCLVNNGYHGYLVTLSRRAKIRVFERGKFATK